MPTFLSLLLTFSLISFASGSELTQKVDMAMKRYIESSEISGAVTMALHKGEVIHFSAIGTADLDPRNPMRKDTLFRIASLTKNYSAVLVKILEERGKLSVHDQVAKYLPEFSSITLEKEDGAGEIDLKIWHLMTHTAGVNVPENYHLAPDLKTAAQLIATQKLDFRPGTKWKYSKGMDVCGRIVEVVSGKSFDQFLKESITDPLGLTDTAYYVEESQAHRLAKVCIPDLKSKGIMLSPSAYLKGFPKKGQKPNPSSGLISSTKDVGTYYSMLLNGGIHKGTRILSKKSIQELTRNWTKEMNTNPITGTAWGLGFGHIREPQDVTAMLSKGTFGHGGAYGTQAWVDPVTEVIYILMIQRLKFGNGDKSSIRKEFQQIVADNYLLKK